MSQKRPRRAILQINAGYLQKLLQIPEEAEIDGIALDFCQPDLVLIRIVGAGWPTGPGQTIVPTTGNVMDGVIDWKLPKPTEDKS